MSNTISKETKIQQMVTERLQNGYEVVDVKTFENQELVYMLGKEDNDDIEILVIKSEGITYEKTWKKSDLHSLQLLKDMMDKEKISQ